MTRNLKPITPRQRVDIGLAIFHLKLARKLLDSAECPKAADAVRRALKSSEGARRHAVHRAMT